MSYTAKNYRTDDKWVVTGELEVANGGKLTVNGQEVGGGSSSVAWTDVTGKPTSFPSSSQQISDATAVGKSVLTATDAAAARTAIGASGAVPTGTAQQLQDGTDTTPRLFSAKMIHDEIARQIAAGGSA